MGIKITIPVTFDTLNEVIDANRTSKGSWNKGNSMKKRDQRVICSHLPKVRFKNPVFLSYHFYEPNRYRDKDNIAGYFHKIFQDALVQAGVIENDGWKNITGFSDDFDVDKANPRIEIEIEEIT